jgi:hypothetical protein
MDDILSQGGDNEPSPWPRRLAVIAPLIVVIVGAAVYLSLPRHPQAPAAAHPTPAATATAPPGPNGIAGPTLTWDSSVVLPADGTRPAWFEPASGRSEPIGGLPANRFGYQFIRVAGGWAVQASPGAQAGCDSCAGPPAPVWFLADGARSVTRTGPANLVAPAAIAGNIWLTSYPLGAEMTTAAGTAREVGATGTVTKSVRLPPGYEIDQGTDRGLLLAPVTQQPGAATVKLWDPSAPWADRAFDGVLATSSAEIAWTSNCAPTCSVHTLDLATGRDTVIALPAGTSAVSGAFSPDGSYLALQMSFGNTGDGGDLAMQLEVVPTATGRLTLVPGTWASSDALVGFGWPAGGDHLVAEFNFTTKTQLASWQPGASRPAVTAVRSGRDQSSLILG